MDPKYRDKKITECTEEELIALEFLGPNALVGVKKIVEQIRRNPERLGQYCCLEVEVLRAEHAYPKRSSTPTQSSK